MVQEMVPEFHLKGHHAEPERCICFDLIVTNAKALDIKTSASSFGGNGVTSRLFLSRLAKDPNIPANVRLDAARRLPEAEQRVVKERARKRARATPDEERQREIDRILAEAAEELGFNLADAEGPEPLAESTEAIAIGSPAALPNVPVDEVSSNAGSRSQALRHVLQDCNCPEPISVRLPDSDTKREELLAQGRALAITICAQLERCYCAPFNHQEGKKLDSLQAKFLEFERQAHLLFPDIDTLKEFPDARLRPPQPKVMDARTYQAHRHVLAIAPPRQTKPTHADSGMWGGLPAI